MDLAAEGPVSPTIQVKAAMAAATAGTSTRANRNKSFVFDHVSPRESKVAPLLGIYLGFAVARVHERFPFLEVPYLLWTMMAVMLLTLYSAIPRGGLQKAWQNSPQLRLVATLGVLAIITVPLGIWMQGALDYLINRFTIAIAVYLACLFLLRDNKSLRRVVTIFVAMATVVAVANVLGYFNHDVSLTMMSPEERLIYQQTGEFSQEAMRQTFGSLDPNDLAAVMATTLPLALWLATGSFVRRMIWTPCAMVMAIGVVPTQSRGGLLGLAAAAVVLILVGTRGFKRIAMAGTLTIGALAFMQLAGDRIGNISGEDYNFTQSEGRIAIWKRGIVWTIKRPWGYGLNNFPYYFGLLNGPDRAAHNSLIQYSVELGVLGISAYLLICASLVKSLLKIRQNAIKRGREGQELATLSGHILAMLAACWTTGFFLSNAYYPLTYMALGIGSAVVLSRIGSNDATMAAAAPPPIPTGPAGRRRRQFKAFQAA